MSTERARGFTIVEAVVAIAIFAVIASVAYAVYTNALSLERQAANKDKALWLAEEGIEATRSIRDQSFSNLTAGTKGLSNAGGSWQFSGTSDVTDGFTRTIALASGGTDTVNATSTVTWTDHGSAKSVSLASVLTNWHKSIGAATAMSIDTSASCVYTLDSRYLGNVKLTYDGSVGTTTITGVKMAWTGVTGVTLSQVLVPYPTSIWTGSTASGATTTLTTPISFTAAGTKAVTFMWNSSVIAAKTFTITFIASDGSTLSSTITTPLISICL